MMNRQTPRRRTRESGIGSQAPPAKRVRFETYGSDKIKTYDAFIDIPRSQLDKPNMWWSRHERQEIMNKCHSEIDGFRENNMAQVRHFLGVFEHCQESPSQASSDFLEKASISLPSRVRGLEWGIVPSTVSHRKTHVKKVLAAQKQVASLNADMRDRVVSSRSLKSSRPGRILARLLADSDQNESHEAECSSPRFRSLCSLMPPSR